MKYVVPSKKSLMWKILKHYLIIIILVVIFLVFSLLFFYRTNSQNAMYLSQMLEMQDFTNEISLMYDNTQNYYYNQSLDYRIAYNNSYQKAFGTINNLAKQYNDNTYIYSDMLAILDSYNSDGLQIMAFLDAKPDLKLNYQKNIVALERLKSYLQNQSSLAIGALVTESQQYSYSTLSTYGKTNIIAYITIFFFTLLCIIFAYNISMHIATPIRQLSVKFYEAAGGTSTTSEYRPNKVDEIDILSDSYNSMVEKLKQSQDAMLQKTEMEFQLQKETLDRIKMENLLKESELKFLQMQINPHFLFNTLNSTCSLAQIEGANATGEMISSLSNLLRHTLTTVNQLVSLSTEIEIVENYLFIQKMRFGHRLNYVIDISDDCRTHMVPSMIIQPLVENAIIHGLETQPGGGCVSIIARYIDTKLLVIVKDNGCGMTSEILNHINNSPDENDEDNRQSIGVTNVKKRLQMLYNESPIKVESVLGQGTSVHILI
jgi:Predicted signal transduction protein with a C-terminal ATPase domain